MIREIGATYIVNIKVLCQANNKKIISVVIRSSRQYLLTYKQ